MVGKERKSRRNLTVDYMNQQIQCPICERSCELLGRSLDTACYQCLRCGRFCLTGTVLAIIPNALGLDGNKRALVSHAIQRMQTKNSRPPVLNSETIKRIVEHEQLPTPFEQGNNLIVWLGDHSLELSSPGKLLTLDSSTKLSVTGSRNVEEFDFIVTSLAQRGLLTSKLLPGGGMAQVMLSFSGWEYYYDLKNKSIVSFKAFMAMKFGNSLLDDVYKNHFKLAVKATGFDLFRVDDVPRAGLIDDKIRSDIRAAKFLIADLTDENPGAYWEAGYAEGLGKPVIYTCQKSAFEVHSTHFDTNHHLTVIWDENDLVSATQMLKATIRATLPSEAKMNDD